MALYSAEDMHTGLRTTGRSGSNVRALDGGRYSKKVGNAIGAGGLVAPVGNFSDRMSAIKAGSEGAVTTQAVIGGVTVSDDVLAGIGTGLAGVIGGAIDGITGQPVPVVVEPPKKDNTLLIVGGAVVACILLVVVFKKG